MKTRQDILTQLYAVRDSLVKSVQSEIYTNTTEDITGNRLQIELIKIIGNYNTVIEEIVNSFLNTESDYTTYAQYYQIYIVDGTEDPQVIDGRPTYGNVLNATPALPTTIMDVAIAVNTNSNESYIWSSSLQRWVQFGTSANINILNLTVEEDAVALGSTTVLNFEGFTIVNDSPNRITIVNNDSTYALVNGSGTTFSTDRYNLGGTLTADALIDGAFNYYIGNTTRIVNSVLNATTSSVFNVRNIAVNANESSIVLNTGFARYLNDDTVNSIVSGVYLSDPESVRIESNKYGGSGSGISKLVIDQVNGHVFTEGRVSGPGLQYAADYSANYTTRSLVDKGYVDSLSSTLVAGSGITNNTGNLDLGGVLTRGATFTGNYIMLFGTTLAPLNKFEIHTSTPGNLLDYIQTTTGFIWTATTSPLTTFSSMVLDDSGLFQLTSNYGVVSRVYTISGTDGFKEGGDYRTSYTTRTLVSKQYVDSFTGTNGLTKVAPTTGNSGGLRLGGTLNQTTTITGALQVLNFGTSGSRITTSENYYRDLFVVNVASSFDTTIATHTPVSITLNGTYTPGGFSSIANLVVSGSTGMSFSYNNGVTTRQYNINGSAGLMEAADYTLTYNVRSLIARDYVDGFFEVNPGGTGLTITLTSSNIKRFNRVTANSGIIDITLPAVSTIENRFFTFKKVGGIGSTVRLFRQGSDVFRELGGITGVTSITIADNNVFNFYSVGGTFFEI